MTLRSILGLHSYHVIVILQLLFFLDMSPVKRVVFTSSLVKKLPNRVENWKRKLARSINKKSPKPIEKLKKKIKNSLTKL